MLLLVFALVFILATVFPAIDFSANAVRDVRGVGDARLAAETLQQTVLNLNPQGALARKTVTLFVPKNATIICTIDPSNRVGFSYSLEGPPASACNNSVVCEKNFLIPNAVSLGCNGFPLLGPQTRNVVVDKADGQTTVSVQ